MKHNSFSNSVLDKKALKLRAVHNQALSARNGVSMGLANESGSGAVSLTTMRQNMETHKKMYENSDKERDVRGSALAHGSIGSILTALGGRKADAFSHLDHQLNYSRAQGDKWLEANTLRTLSELQENSGDLKQVRVCESAFTEYQPTQNADTSVCHVAVAKFVTISNLINTSFFAPRFACRRP